MDRCSRRQPGAPQRKNKRTGSGDVERQLPVESLGRIRYKVHAKGKNLAWSRSVRSPSPHQLEFRRRKGHALNRQVAAACIRQDERRCVAYGSDGGLRKL